MKETVGKRLKKFGDRRFATKRAFADALDMSYENLYQYLEDKAKPGTDFLKRLADLKCNINWLLTGKEDIHYSSVDETINYNIPLVKEYKILGVVPAGNSSVNEYNEWMESDDLNYDPNTHFYLRIDNEFGYSMMPLVNPGDLILVSYKDKVKDGDLVAARWDKTKGALKIYKENPGVKDYIVLTSYNQAVEPIFLKKSEVKLYKVVLIKKKK